MQVGICPVALKIPVDEVKPLVRVKKIFLRWCSARRSFLGAGCAGAEGVHGPRIPDIVAITGCHFSRCGRIASSSIECFLAGRLAQW